MPILSAFPPLLKSHFRLPYKWMHQVAICLCLCYNSFVESEVVFMIKILFVCHGNICRSPMAEFIMKELVQRKGVAHLFDIASAATSDEELGSPPYPPVRALLSERGISTKGKLARQLTKSDYEKYDYFIGMDSANRRNMLRLFANDPLGKVSLLLDYTDHPRDVADPWYTRDFRTTERDVDAGCEKLLNFLLSK